LIPFLPRFFIFLMAIKINSDNTDPDVRVEIVPLIDVIFCILTFFILAAVTLTRQAAINVDLPSAKTGTTQMRQILVVSVDPIGQTYVEKIPVGDDQLRQALLQFKQDSPEGLIVLYASRASSYNDVVRVLDLLRSVGGNRVALATLPSAGDPNAANDQPFPGTLPGTLPGSTSNPLNPSTLPGTTLPNSPSGANPLPGLGLPSNPQPNSSGDGSTQPLPGLGLPNSNAQPGAGTQSLPLPQSGTSSGGTPSNASEP
jgi:biopolymer transport protein ExbD